MHALSGRRIETMASRLAERPQPMDAVAQIRLAVETAVGVILEEPDVNRAVMGWIGTAGPARGDALANSTALWARALGEGRGIAGPRGTLATGDLPRQLALAFRGTLSFWTAGELPDEELGPTALAIAETLTSAFFERPAPPLDSASQEPNADL